MSFKEYLEKNKKIIENMSFKDIEELKKFADERKITYSEEELKQAWNYLEGPEVSEDGSLDDDALDSVAGGKGTYYNNIGNTTEIGSHNKDIKTGAITGNVNADMGGGAPAPGTPAPGTTGGVTTVGSPKR